MRNGLKLFSNFRRMSLPRPISNGWSLSALYKCLTSTSMRKVPLMTKFSMIFPAIYAISYKPTTKRTQEVIHSIELSDKSFDSLKYRESYEALTNFKDCEDDEILWRLCRGLYNLTTEGNLTPGEIHQYIEEAEAYIKRAIAINENNYAVQKWSAIILNARTSQEGVKAHINALPAFKYHIMRAIELNPQDATSLHMLGTYFYNIADLPWYQKKIASALFGKVPDATFEEALVYFNKAEETSPNFYSTNLLMLGKTYMKLEMIDSARHWLQRAADSAGKTEADKLVKKEAADLLKNIQKGN